MIGFNQAEAYERETGRSIRRGTRPVVYKLGDGEKESTGIKKVRITLTDGSHTKISIHVVKEDFRLIIEIEILNGEKLRLPVQWTLTQCQSKKLVRNGKYPLP